MSNPNSDGNNPRPPPISNAPANERKSNYHNLLWVLLVLLGGALLGFVIFVGVAAHLSFGATPPPPGLSGRLRADVFTNLAEHIILSTISIALLTSLVVVYARIYSQTRANFALGIFIVLLALLFQAILSSPVLELYLVTGLRVPLNSTPLLAFADVLTIVAYTIFLYLSLE